MIKTIKYFFEALVVYSFFLVAKLIGINSSRKVFSIIFKKIGPVIRSNNSVIKNLNKFQKNISNKEQKKNNFKYVV